MEEGGEEDEEKEEDVGGRLSNNKNPNDKDIGEQIFSVLCGAIWSIFVFSI